MLAVVSSFVERGTFEGTLAMQRQLVLDYQEDIRKYVSGIEQMRVLDSMETPTVQAALPQMFRSHGEDVMRRAMAVVNVVNQTSALVPAVLGGVLYAAVGAMPMMGITVVGFGVAAVVVCFIRLGAPEREDGGRASALDDLRAAGRFLTRERPHALQLVLLCAALNFLVTGYAEIGFPYMVRTVLGFGSEAYGFSPTASSACRACSARS